VQTATTPQVIAEDTAVKPKSQTLPSTMSRAGNRGLRVVGWNADRIQDREVTARGDFILSAEPMQCGPSMRATVGIRLTVLVRRGRPVGSGVLQMRPWRARSSELFEGSDVRPVGNDDAHSSFPHLCSQVP
jgi:hypothetical protein